MNILHFNNVFQLVGWLRTIVCCCEKYSETPSVMAKRGGDIVCRDTEPDSNGEKRRREQQGEQGIFGQVSSMLRDLFADHDKKESVPAPVPSVDLPVQGGGEQCLGERGDTIDQSVQEDKDEPSYSLLCGETMAREDDFSSGRSSPLSFCTNKVISLERSALVFANDQISREIIRYIERGAGGARRLLHDSVSVTSQRDYRYKYSQLTEILSNVPGSMLCFHDESTNGQHGNNEWFKLLERFKQVYFTDRTGESEPDSPDIFGRVPEERRACSVPWYRQWNVLDETGKKEIYIHGDRSEWFFSEDSVEYEAEMPFLGQEQAKFETPNKGHFHVWHPCRWYNSYCRHLGKSIDVVKRLRRIGPIEQYTDDHIRNTVFYFSKHPRWLLQYTDSDSITRRFIFGTQCVRSAEVSDNEIRHALEDGNAPMQDDDVRSDASGPSTSGTNKVAERGNAKQSRSRDQSTKEILDFFITHTTYPIDHLMQTTDWHKSRNRYLISSDKTVKRAITLLQLQLSNWSFEDFMNHYRRTDIKTIWAATCSEKFDEYYMNMEDSIDVVEKLLDYQCGMNKVQFIQDLYNVLEKKVPKKNALQIISAPSAGKNFLLDAIMSFYWNVGFIQNFNRYQSFPLMEAIDRRVNCWNEPNFEPSAEDTIKMLLGGDPIKVQVKYEKERNIQRTPILVMTNKNVFRQNQAFQDRMYTHHWERAEFLRNYDRKVHPMIWSYLVSTYLNVFV